MKNWKKNLYVVFFAEMIAITGMKFVMPFLPFYIKELGISDT
jgi:DHA1 family multidrug resistance protein-like MFS transporter